MAIAALACALAGIKVLVLVEGFPVHFDPGEIFAMFVGIPMTVVFTYFLAVFSYGLEGDLAAPRSMYPARMFTRPVTTASLAAWPMLYGAATTAILWTVIRLLALWPSSLHVPLIWPGMLLVAHLGWTQALTWLPYGLPGLRVLVVILWLTVIDIIVLLALHLEVSEPVMAAILLPLIPLAWPVARSAVARARRGDVPDWHGGFTWLPGLARLARRASPFTSPAGAQAWFEWRRNGWSLPVWVGILLPPELLLLRAAGPSTTLVVEILLGVCLTPVIMATFAAVTVSRSSPNARASYSLSPFIAARPLTSAQLVAAKLTQSLWSTAIAWLLVLVAIPLGLQLSGEMPLAVERARRLAEVVGTPRAVGFLLLLVAGFVAATWKQLVQSLYIGLTGREWLSKGSVFIMVTVLVCLGPIAVWIVETRRVGVVWLALPTVLAVLVGCKMIAAMWIAVRLYRHRLVRDSTLLIGAACWCVAVFALYGVLVWMAATAYVPRYLLMLLAILAMPLARVSAAPLALGWNRHR
jgi:hypothetical protein